jgi:hypothetical protein
MRTMLHSSRLQLTRDGRVLAAAEPDAVALVEVHGGTPRRIELPGVQAIAAFGDEVWAATGDGVLVRLGRDGRWLGEHALPPDPGAVLIPAAVGAPAALWTAREPVLLADDLGALASTSGLTGEAIPIAGRRVAHYAGLRVTLPGSGPATLVAGVRIAGGAAVFDGTALALIVEHLQGRSLAVLALAGGRILHTLALPQGIVRIAARRGLAVVLDAARRLAVIDLRFGRRLGAVATDDDVADFAVDPDGGLLAIRLAGGDLELAPIAARAGAAARWAAPPEGSGEPDDAAPEGEPTPEAAPGAPPEEPTPAAPEPAPTPPEPAWPDEPTAEVRPFEPRPPVIVDALEPRPRREILPRVAALAELDRELRSVMLWTLCAISSAWDTRRLGYGDEGHHPYEHEVAALVGKNAGFAPDHLAAARAALVEHAATLAADPLHRGPATPLAALADEHGLSPAALDILLAVAAPALHGDAARLYGILGNDPGRALVDEALLQRILGDRLGPHDLAAELHPRAPLVRLGIVDIEPERPRPFAALAVEPVVLARLRGEPPELGAALAMRHADRALAALDLAPGVFASALDALARAARPLRLAIRGRAGAGRRALLAAFAERAGRALGVIDATLLPRDAELFAAALAAALRRAQLASLLPVVAGLDAVVLGDRAGGELAREVLAAHPGPLAIIAPPGASPPLPLGHAAIDLPALSETERLGVWQRALAAGGRWLRDAAGLAARYRVGPGVIHRAAAAVADHDPLAPCDDRLEAFLRQTRDLRLAGHARRVERLASWADLVLPPDVMDSLRELVGRVRHRRTVFEDWGMGRTLPTARGLTALFSGQPGTGKTLVAGVIARELGLDLYQVDLSKVMSKWIGETERNLASIFDAAEDGQVILLFDEADSLFAKRTEVRSSNDRYANLEVNYLLQRLDAFEGFAILTTNASGSIDPAFKRRLSFRLSFPFPDEDTRAELWRAHLPRELPRAGELVFHALAHKYQLSGGYIRNACLRAAFLAAQEETALHQHHLERAVALEFAELGKLSTTGSLE